MCKKAKLAGAAAFSSIRLRVFFIIMIIDNSRSSERRAQPLERGVRHVSVVFPQKLERRRLRVALNCKD